jgi:hypothetical protein
MLRFNEIIYRVSSVIWIKKKRKESFFFISETSTKRSIIDILDEKTSFKIEFDNHSRVFVSARLISWCRFILLNIFNSESKHIKHRVNLVNLDSQRFRASLRATLSSRFFWFFKSFDYEMHEKCHQFTTSSEVAIIQNDDERLKSRQIIKSYEERKQIFFDQWNLKTD